ncbi:unnamed protein product, partial [Sphenostylis stenocarpa]
MAIIDTSEDGMLKIFMHDLQNGQIYILIIELRDPSIHAIEFVLKDDSHDRWLKLNHINFQIEIPASDAPVIISHSDSSTPKDLIDHRANSQWEGRPVSLSQQHKQHYDNALTELPNHLSKGIILNKSWNSYPTGGIKPVNDNRDKLRSCMQYSYLRKYNIEDWLQKHSEGNAKGTTSTAAVVENFIGGTYAMSRRIYHVHNYEIVVSFLVIILVKLTGLVLRCFTGVYVNTVQVRGWCHPKRYGQKTRNWFQGHVKAILRLSFRRIDPQ